MSSVFHINVFQTLLINVNSSHWNMLKRDSYWLSSSSLSPLGPRCAQPEQHLGERMPRTSPCVQERPWCQASAGVPHGAVPKWSVLRSQSPVHAEAKPPKDTKTGEGEYKPGAKLVDKKGRHFPIEESTLQTARDTPPERSAKRTGRVLVPFKWSPPKAWHTIPHLLKREKRKITGEWAGQETAGAFLGGVAKA